jgi:hypothetical protein
MSDLREILGKRDEQTRRVLAALGRHDRESTVSIILSWMSIDDVEHMLLTLEKPQ